MSGNKNSGNRNGRSSPKVRAATVAPRAPSEKAEAARVKVFANAPPPLTAIPEPPADAPWWDDRAAELYRRFARKLIMRGALYSPDLPLLELVVGTWRMWEIEYESAQAEGKSLGVAAGIGGRALAALNKIGLTPDARVVIAPPEVAKKSPDEVFGDLTAALRSGPH